MTARDPALDTRDGAVLRHWLYMHTLMSVMFSAVYGFLLSTEFWPVAAPALIAGTLVALRDVQRKMPDAR